MKSKYIKRKRRKMSYENGKIDKIVCLITGLQYIGSTRQIFLKHWLSNHVDDFYRWNSKQIVQQISFCLIFQNHKRMVALLIYRDEFLRDLWGDFFSYPIPFLLASSSSWLSRLGWELASFFLPLGSDSAAQIFSPSTSFSWSLSLIR